jgi:hypothetical protein
LETQAMLNFGGTCMTSMHPKAQLTTSMQLFGMQVPQS